MNEEEHALFGLTLFRFRFLPSPSPVESSFAGAVFFNSPALDVFFVKLTSLRLSTSFVPVVDPPRGRGRGRSCFLDAFAFPSSALSRLSLRFSGIPGTLKTSLGSSGLVFVFALLLPPTREETDMRRFIVGLSVMNFCPSSRSRRRAERSRERRERVLKGEGAGTRRWATRSAWEGAGKSFRRW